MVFCYSFKGSYYTFAVLVERTAVLASSGRYITTQTDLDRGDCIVD